MKVIFGLPDQCINLDYLACYYTGTDKIYIGSQFEDSAFHYNFFAYHELAHYCGYDDEVSANEFAYFWNNEKANDRWMEYYVVTRACRVKKFKKDEKLKVPPIALKYENAKKKAAIKKGGVQKRKK